MELSKVMYLIFLMSSNTLALPAEPVCSKFDYEIKTLEVMLRTEQKVEKMMEDTKNIRETVMKELGEIKAFKTQLLVDFGAFKDNLENTLREEQEQRREDINLLSDKAVAKLVLVDNALEVLNNKTKDPVIAFSVTNPTRSLVNGIPIFTTVTTNIGDGYDKDTGIFTCPTDGLYLFLFNLASRGKNDVYCRIQHNGSNVAFGRTYLDNLATTTGASVYLMLSKGDKVNLGSCGGWSNVYNNDKDTSFNGALIRQIVLGN